MKVDKFEIKDVGGSFFYLHTFIRDTGGEIQVRTVYSPTGNCQFFSIRHFASIIASGLYKLTDDEIIFIFEEVFKKVGKKMIFIDIKEQYYEKLKKFFILKYDAVLNQKYKSTNGSEMRALLLKTERYLLKNNK